ncbi:hypothetical protein BGZ76_010053 [Entomortierella beljakovae]|nr:hypothetical protein BGZ76_010053 [Entomortierella beljakovae]
MIPRYVALHPSNDDDMDDSNFENVELEVIDDQEDFLETSAPLQLLTTASNNENSRYRSTYNNNSGDDSDDDSSEWDIQSSVENLAINNNRDSLRDFITRRAHTSRNTSDPEYQGMVELQDYLESSRKAGDSKWFFQEQYYKHYSGTDIISGPVLIKDEFQATIPTADFPPGLYYVTLCISLRGIDLNDIESMSVHCNSPTKESKTTIYSNELYYLPIYGTARLRLHQQVDISNLEPLSISIYFQCKSGEEVELYYVELQKRDPSPGIDYLITGFVRPQRSIDVWHTDNPGLPDEPKHPCWIEQYAVSSDGAYIATLSYTSIHAHIDVWNILTSEISFPSGYLHDNVPTAQKSTPWNGERILGLSISCDASQIAVYTINDTNKKVFAFHLLKHISPETFMPAEPTQDLMLANEAIRDCPELKKFIGYGKFLVSKVDDSTQFIACDALSVTLYNTDGKWTKVFSSSLSLENNLHHASILVNSATADQFLWTGNEDVMSIWDMSTGNPKTFVPLQSRWNAWSACFSADGSMVVLSYLEGIKIYEAKSGIELGIFRCHMSSCARRAVFIHDDTQILVDTGPQHDSPFQGYNCFTLDVRTLSQKELKYMPDSQDVMVHVTSGNSPRNEFLIHGHGSILDITHLHHHTLQSPDLNGVKCHQGCYSSRTYLSVDNREFSLYTGFEFQISMKDTIRKDGFIDKGLTTVVVAVNSWRDGYKEILSINPFEIYGMSKKDAKFIQAFVLAPRPHFAVISNLFVQIWSLPTEANPNCELLLVWKFSNTSRESFDGAIYSCAHGDQLFLSFIARHPGKRMERETYHCTLANVFGINSSTLFLEGIAYLPLMYSEAGEQARQAIIRYTSLHINSYPSPENIGNSVMTTLCKSWDDNTQNQCKAFMQDLLLTGQPRWTPRIDYTSESNPLSMLLGKAKKHPRVMGLARIIITYCINQAKQQQNPGYMAPVFGCLDELVKYSPKLALEFFQSMAYFPAAHRCVLINNYLIAHRPTIRPFWKKNNRPIHKCNDPVFQLHFKPENTDPLNDNFTKDIYVAPFDLLWKYDNLEHSWGDNPSTQKKWLYKFVRYIALLAMGLNYVQVHDCTLDFYDNPAIEALIEYKWNRFGFAFWLVRFIFQCIYYCLVLAVALLQIYHDDREVLHYLFIAIITFSAIFLWFEFLQLRRHWRRYTTSAGIYRADGC